MSHALDAKRRFWIWPAGWFLVGLGIATSDLLSYPAAAPLWPAFVFGALGWGLATVGSTRAEGRRRLALGLVWALLFACNLLLGLHWGSELEGRGGPGFVGLIASAGLAGAAGGLATRLFERAGLGGALFAFLPWGVLFAAATWLGVVSLYVLVLLADAFVARIIGEFLALTLACGLGWGVGGVVAGLAPRLAGNAPGESD